MSEEYKPLTKDAVLNPFVFVDDVRYAVMGFKKEYCYCENLLEEDELDEETPYCSVCADIIKWFPVFFDDEEVQP